MYQPLSWLAQVTVICDGHIEPAEETIGSLKRRAENHSDLNHNLDFNPSYNWESLQNAFQNILHVQVFKD